MDKSVLISALGKAKGLSDSEWSALTLEDVGALRAFVASRPAGQGPEAEFLAHIHRLIQQWEQGPKNAARPHAEGVPPPQSERRTQMALRRVIDLIQRSRWDDIREDDIRLVRGSYEALKNRAASNNDSGRLLNLMQTMLRKYDWFHGRNSREGREKNESDALSIFHHSLEQLIARDAVLNPIRNVVHSERDFTSKQISHKTMLDHVECDLHARLFEYEGDTEVSGQIPNDVLVVVTGGGVTIHGFVAGNILADGPIRVLGNVQGGMIISRGGDIWAEQILIGSHVIAKKGSLRCHSVEAPKIAFAWDLIQVEGAVRGGRFCAAEIHVDGPVTAAELHTCGKAFATSFETSPRKGSSVFFERTIGCEDYGQPLDAGQDNQINQLKTLDDERRRALAMNEFTNRLIENTYRTALYYLAGGTESAQSAFDLQGLQSRVMLLGQLILLGESLAEYYATRAAAIEPVPKAEIAEFRAAAERSLAAIETEANRMPEEFGSVNRRFMQDRCREMASLIADLDSQRTKEKMGQFLNTKFMRVLSQWKGNLGESERRAKDVVDGFQIDAETLRDFDGDADTLEVLLTHMTGEFLASDDPEKLQRANSPLVRILQTNAARLEKNIKQQRRRARAAQEELDRIKTALEEEGILKFGSPRPHAASVTAQSFAPGTIISANAQKTAGHDTAIGEVIAFERTLTGPATFARSGNVVQRISR